MTGRCKKDIAQTNKGIYEQARYIFYTLRYWLSIILPDKSPYNATLGPENALLFFALSYLLMRCGLSAIR